MEHWGEHLILNCRACNDIIRDKAGLTQFAKDLVDVIDMKAFGEPQVEHFAGHDVKAGGYTLVQLIETSAITGHFVDANGDAYLDIFSCKEVDVKKAVDFIQERLQPKNISITFLQRQA